MKINTSTALKLLYGKSDYVMVLVRELAVKEGEELDAERVWDAAQVAFKIIALGYAELGDDRTISLTEKGSEIAYILREDSDD